jgi:hypothetical protein
MVDTIEIEVYTVEVLYAHIERANIQGKNIITRSFQIDSLAEGTKLGCFQ